MSGVRTALFVSLAANLLLAGVIGGAVLSNARHDRVAAQQAVMRSPNARAILQALPPDRAQGVREKVIAAFREGRAERQEARRARVEAFRVANADVYDPAAVKAAFARLRAADGKVAGRFQDTVADALAELSVEERRAVLRELARRRVAGQRPLSAREGEAPRDVTPEAPAPQP